MVANVNGRPESVASVTRVREECDRYYFSLSYSSSVSASSSIVTLNSFDSGECFFHCVYDPPICVFVQVAIIFSVSLD